MSRAVPSGFRQSRGHSRHGYFIDLRHIICTACLQAGFHSSGTLCLGKLLPTSRALRRKTYCTVPACRSFKVGVSRRYPLIPPIGIPVCKVLLPCTQPFQLRTCRTRPILVSVEHRPVGQLPAVLIRHGEDLPVQLLDDEAHHEKL